MRNRYWLIPFALYSVYLLLSTAPPPNAELVARVHAWSSLAESFAAENEAWLQELGEDESTKLPGPLTPPFASVEEFVDFTMELGVAAMEVTSYEYGHIEASALTPLAEMVRINHRGVGSALRASGVRFGRPVEGSVVSGE